MVGCGRESLFKKMMDKLSKFPLSAIVLLSTILAPGVSTFSCTTPQKNPNAPPFPSIPGDSYQAHVEINLINKNRTLAIEEYLDYEGNRAARITHDKDSITTVLYSYDTDEIFVIKDLSCNTLNMSSQEASPYLFAAGSSKVPSGGDRRKAFASAAVFKAAANNSDFYLGKAKVRGIPVNQWSLCIPNTMLITYSFNDPAWSMATNNVVLPVRIEIVGNGKNHDGTPGNHDFHHIYDFIDYQPDISADPSIFETPLDVVCTGRKSTKTLPTFPKRFQYKAESIDPTLNVVTHYSVWYDGEGKMVRIDNRALAPQPPVFTTHPTTEVHDFSTGVRYIKDRVTGNCSVHPLSSSSDDVSLDTQQTLEMKDPARFFTFSKNYVYSGERMVRGMKCDVYSAVIPDYKVMGGITTNASFHYFFLSDDWVDYPLQDNTADVSKYPVHLEIETPDYVGMNSAFNFFDFDESPLDIDIFDVTDCFDDSKKLGFQVTFPGKYSPATEDTWKYYAHFKIALLVPMPPLRIGGLELSADLDNVYVNGYFLGRNPFAEFQLVGKNSVERDMDKNLFSVHLPQDCATLCVDNKDFLCEGFQYCPDSGFKCGLGKGHTLNQTKKVDGKSCDFFTRTVLKTRVEEPQLNDAYSALESKINDQELSLQIEGPDGFVSQFVAIRIKQTSGPSDETKPLPSISSQFSYRVETVIPKAKTTSEAYVWYDETLQLVRFDNRNLESGGATNEHSKIYDFNEGVLYTLDKVTNECTIKPISVDDSFDVDKVASKSDKYGGLQIKMKSPLQLFYMDNTYKYIGQKTIRGILCDGYQAKRSDFVLEELLFSTENSVFTIYFMAEPWMYYTAQSMEITRTQPLQIVIEDITVDAVLIYNFFDFDDEHHNFNYFDVSACYPYDQKKTFEIIFKNQPFHPYLDASEPTFLNTVVTKLGEATSTSPLRFQQVSVYSDDSDLYVIATVLGQLAPQYLFQPVTKVNISPHEKTMVVSSLNDCAAACADFKGSPCNSFDFCPDPMSPKCSLLSADDEFPQTGIIQSNGSCTHYSRSEKGGIPMYTIQELYITIADYIYDKRFSVLIYQPDGSNYTYYATDVRDDLLQPTDPTGEAGSVLSQFSVTKNRKFQDSAILETHPLVSVADCALICASTTTLRCESFDYDYNHGTCRLSGKHVDEVKLLAFSPLVNVYTTSYTKDYKEEGMVFPNSPDKTLYTVASSELCARSCDEESSFKCESFDYCPSDKSCYLRKSHNLPRDTSSHVDETPICSHFSRNHLYDFTKISSTVIVGHDDFVTTVTSDAECALHCSHGEIIDCASFEVCDVVRGETECRLSMADPTLQLNLTRRLTRECNLYVKANPTKKIIKPIPPAVNPTTSTVTAGSGSKTTKTECNKVDTGKQHQQSSSSSSDTGVRAGIAFGTLFLGLFIGAAGMFLFSKWYRNNKPKDDDSHQLSDYSAHTDP